MVGFNEIKEMSVTSLKEEGNDKFKNGDYEKALSLYTEALDLGDIKDSHKAAIYKNRAMCFLKLKEYDDAIKDATAALEISPNDPKALYRRSMAYEQLEKLEDAYKDAVQLVKVDPKNTSVKPLLNRLTPIMREKTINGENHVIDNGIEHEKMATKLPLRSKNSDFGKAKKQTGTKEKINQMFNLAFDSTVEKEKRLQAANNLVVITREDGGSDIIAEVGGIEKLKDMLNKEKDTELLHAFIRTLACLARGSKPRCLQIYNEVGVVRLGQVMALPVEGLPTSVALLLQNMLESITDLSVYRAEKEKHDEKRRAREPCRPPKFEIDEFQQKFVDEVFYGLVKMLQHVKVSAYGRDAAIELIIKMVTRKTGVHWTRKFLDTEGIEALLMIAGAMKQHETLPVTDLSKTHAALLLNTLWEDLMSEKENDKFKERVSDFFKEMFGNEDWESKVEAIKCISMLLQGPFEVGNMILGFEGVTEIMLGLADSDRAYHQQVAVEAIVHSASKKNKCMGLLKEAVPVLKKLYHDGADDKIKIRALVGLCKLGSFEGSDASTRPMADGSTVTLAKACRKFMTNPQGDLDMKQWGTEGLAYLTLDADVKEDLVHDPVALKAVIEASMNPSLSFSYAAATLFVNLTNSIDKQEMVPEMVELAKYAKQHVPEEHPKDKEEFVKERIKRLVQAGMIPAICMLSKTESQNTREQCSRVLLTVATDESYRGQIVQVGGVKVLLNMFKEKNTDLGRQVAAQTLAKLAITQDPNLAFNGQRMYEIVKPLISLLHIDRSGLQNFEALLALTNLSSVSDSVRNRIVSEKGLQSIEHWLYEEHEMIRRAAIECMCNMVMNEKVAKLFEGENDRVKFFTLQCGDEDEKVQKAAAGALAVLTIDNAVICKKILQLGKWVELLLSVAVSDDADIQHRGCYILRNMVTADREVAEKVLEGQLLEVLMAVSILEVPEKQAARQCALEALQKAEEYGIIKKNAEKL